MFSLLLVHLLIVEFLHHLAGPHPHLPPTPNWLLLSLIVRPCVLSLRTQNVRSVRWLWGRRGPLMIVLPESHRLQR
jgi:hypothetical protein